MVLYLLYVYEAIPISLHVAHSAINALVMPLKLDGNEVPTGAKYCLTIAAPLPIDEAQRPDVNDRYVDFLANSYACVSNELRDRTYGHKNRVRWKLDTNRAFHDDHLMFTVLGL